MKKIKFQDIEFEYETLWESYGEYGDRPVTIFYMGITRAIRKKWIGAKGGWGLPWKRVKVTEEIPREVFRIYGDSMDTSLSKGWWRDQIQKKIDLMNREEELSRGDLC